MSPLLKLDHLRKSFGERRLLDLDRLEIEAGHAYVITGGNGSGKTTLLRVLAGLESAEIEGLQFQGESPAGTEARQRIVYVHQHPYLFNTSVAGNIAYGLKARGINGALRQRLVEDAIVWAGVGPLRRLPPNKLSGGEKQRVALARAKVLEPPSSPVATRALGPKLLRTANYSSHTHRVATPPRYVLDSTPVSYEAAFRF